MPYMFTSGVNKDLKLAKKPRKIPKDSFPLSQIIINSFLMTVYKVQFFTMERKLRDLHVTGQQ